MVDLSFSPRAEDEKLFDPAVTGRFRQVVTDIDFYGKAAVRRNYWYLALIAVLGLAIYFVVSSAGFKTYILRVDGATGQVRQTDALEPVPYSPGDAEIRYFLVDVVKNLRGLPLDPVVYGNNIARAEAFFTKEAISRLASIIADRKENPLGKMGKYTTDVRLVSFQRQPGTGQTFNIRWQETDYPVDDPAGKTATRNYVGLFTVDVVPPRRQEELLVNPLGIRIRDISFDLEWNVAK